MRLMRGELLKLIKRPATRTTLVVMAVAIAVIYVALGVSTIAVPTEDVRADLAPLLTFPEAYHGLVALFPLFGGLALALYSGLVIGSDWSWGTLRMAFTRGEGRTRYVLTSFAAIAMLAALGMLLLFAVGLVAAAVAGAIAGVDRGDMLDIETLKWLPVGLLAAWFGMVVVAALAYAVSLATRSQVAGIGLVVALFFAEQFAGVFVPPEVLRFAPLSAASGIAADGPLAFAAAAAYLLVALVIGSLVVERAEIA